MVIVTPTSKQSCSPIALPSLDRSGRIKALFEIDIPQPRRSRFSAIRRYVDQIYGLLTQQTVPDAATVNGRTTGQVMDRQQAMINPFR